MAARLKEASKLGFGRAILPAAGLEGAPAGLSLESVATIGDLVARLAGERAASRENQDERIFSGLAALLAADDGFLGSRYTREARGSQVPRLHDQLWKAGIAQMPVSPLDLAVLAVVLISAFLASVRGLHPGGPGDRLLGCRGRLGLFALPAGSALREAIHQQLDDRADCGDRGRLPHYAHRRRSAHRQDFGFHPRFAHRRPRIAALGFLFGAARGALIALVAFAFFVWLVPEKNQPVWMQDSRVRPLLEPAGESLVGLLQCEDPASAMAKGLRRHDEGARQGRAGRCRRCLGRGGSGTRGTGFGRAEAPPRSLEVRERWMAGRAGADGPMQLHASCVI